MRAEVIAADAEAKWEQVRRRIDGLTDDEFAWEPVTGCWSVRAREDGGFRLDWSPEPAQPTPFTTIGWRLVHIGVSLSAHSRRLYGRGSFDFESFETPGTAASATAFVEAAFALWRSGLPVVTNDGGDVDDKLAAEILDLQAHFDHHSVEIRVLRDLYRWRRPLDADPFVDACLRGDVDELRRYASSGAAPHPDAVAFAARNGRWDAVPVLLELGCGTEPATSGSPSALHLAAAAGELGVVRLLIERGADLGRTESQWDATPLGWADYFGHRAVAGELERAAAAGLAGT